MARNHRYYDFPQLIASKENYSWATFAPYRNPQFKVHSSEGMANSAISDKMYDDPVAKYKLQGAHWEKVFEYNPPTHCACGKEFGSYYPPVTLSKVRRMDTEPICMDCYYEQKGQRDSLYKEQREREAYLKLKEKYGE